VNPRPAMKFVNSCTLVFLSVRWIYVLLLPPGKYWRMSAEIVAILIRAPWKRCRMARRDPLVRAGRVSVAVMGAVVVAVAVAVAVVVASKKKERMSWGPVFIWARASRTL
jgi:hypothetical protein